MRWLAWLRHADPAPGGISQRGRLQAQRLAMLLPRPVVGDSVLMIPSTAPRARATAEALLAAWTTESVMVHPDSRLWSGPDRQGDAQGFEDHEERILPWVIAAGADVSALLVVTHYELCGEVLALLAKGLGTRGDLPEQLDRGQGVLFDLQLRRHGFLDGTASRD